MKHSLFLRLLAAAFICNLIAVPTFAESEGELTEAQVVVSKEFALQFSIPPNWVLDEVQSDKTTTFYANESGTARFAIAQVADMKSPVENLLHQFIQVVAEGLDGRGTMDDETINGLKFTGQMAIGEKGAISAKIIRYNGKTLLLYYIVGATNVEEVDNSNMSAVEAIFRTVAPVP